MKITRKMLKEYLPTKQMLPFLRAQLRQEASEIVSDTVKDYKSGFPHTRVITGIPSESQWEKDRAQLRKKEKQIEAVDAWIEAIPDIRTRTVFDLFYRKGRTWKAIAASIGCRGNEDYPRKMIRDRYLEDMKIR